MYFSCVLNYIILITKKMIKIKLINLLVFIKGIFFLRPTIMCEINDVAILGLVR